MQKFAIAVVGLLLAMASANGAALKEPGQGAFATIQEVEERLAADPGTDWSKVNLDALREHLVDMDEVTLHAAIRYEALPRGERIIVTGTGRTRDAIRRMVVDHARSQGDAEHWTMTAQATDDGAIVTVLPKQPGDEARIHALGLLGMMSDGSHHQVHHWMIATGQHPHH